MGGGKSGLGGAGAMPFGSDHFLSGDLVVLGQSSSFLAGSGLFVHRFCFSER